VETPDGLFSSASQMYSQALKVLEEGLAENSMLKMKDAATRAWEAVITAADALILKAMGQLPRSHYERRRLLMSLDGGDPELARRGLYDRFMARSRLFKGELLHEDVLDAGLLRFEVLKAGEFLELIKEKLHDDPLALKQRTST